MLYPVNEIFETIQGEGLHCGRPAIFVRLQGCDVGCSFCDTKQTWQLDPKLEKQKIDVLQVDGEIGHHAWYSSDELVEALSSFSARLVVITGGEPCMYDLTPMSLALQAHGFDVQLETSGTYPILISQNAWVTVSPKVNMKAKKPVLQQALERANEIKHPIGTENHIEQLKSLLAQIDSDNKIIALQPISQQKRATQLAIEHCIANNWRLSAQVHKYLDID